MIKCDKSDALIKEFWSHLLRREGTLTQESFSEKLLVVCPYCEVIELMASTLFIEFFAIILSGNLVLLYFLSDIFRQ